jgi:hypothetical protein
LGIKNTRFQYSGEGKGKKVQVAWGCGLEDNTIQGLIALIRGSRGIISVSHHAGTLK